jgi:general secretion pathway protein K|uniref:General secretion pathway protein GspK n=1 Tax=Leptospirillum ferriphilum TaxID=178606 RepID=A0A7C3LUP5_9BACT
MCKASSPPDPLQRRDFPDPGFALVLVLFMVGLITILVLRFVSQSREVLREAEIFRNQTQAYYLARAAIEAGKVILVSSTLESQQSGQNYTALTQPWATPIINYPVGHHGFLSGRIVDESSKLDINLLGQNQFGGTSQTQLQFERLFSLVGVNPSIIPAIIQWVTPIPSGSAGGGPYQSMIPPYRPRGGPIGALSELHQVAGMTEAEYQALEPYITVASGGQVNVNTASAIVLESLDPGISPAIANQIIQGRPYTSLSALSSILGPAVFANIEGLVTVQSSVFSLQAVGTVGNTRQAIRAILSINGIQTQVLTYRMGGTRLLGQIETLLKEESSPDNSITPVNSGVPP